MFRHFAGLLCLAMPASRCWRPGLFVAVVVCLATGYAKPSLGQQPGLSQGEIHNPFSPNYNALLPVGRGNSAGAIPVAQHTGQSAADQGSSSGGHDHGHHHHQGGGFGRPFWGGTNLTVFGPGYYSSFGVGSFVPGYFPGYYPGFAGGWYGPGFAQPFYRYPYVMPPVVIPAGTMYGPRALWSSLLGPEVPGINPLLNPPLNALDPALIAAPNGNQVDAALGNPAPLQPAPNQPIVQKVRRSSDAVRGRATRLLTVADEDFRAQKYAEAAQRYRRAAQSAPDLADAHFRQGQAEIALSRYEAAAKSCKRGLEAEPNFIASDFRLTKLYGQNEVAKTAHIEKLAQAAEADPENTDLRFLIGIELFFDGQLERSRTFFEQAAALNRGDDAHLIAFLRELDRRVPVAREAAIDL